MTHSVATLNTNMKYVFPNDKPVSLIPSNVKAYKMLPEIKKTAKLGRKALVPVELGAEGGVTYGDGTAFAYDPVVDGTWSEAQVDATPVVLNMQLSRDAMDRLAEDRDAFVDIMTLRTKSMTTELARRAESGFFYGKSSKGLATITNTTGTSGTTLVVQVTAGQWSPAVWVGRKNHRFEFRSSAGAARAGHSTNYLTLSSVDFINQKLTFTGNSGEIATVVATDVIWFRGSYTNDMFGIDYQLTASGSVFGIDNTLYDTWKSASYTLASNNFSEFIKGLGVLVAQSGISEDTICWINSTKWESLNSTVTNQNYRNSGSSDNAAARAGVKALYFTTQAGETTLIGSPYVKESDSFVYAPSDLLTIGVKKISFDSSNGKGEYWIELPSNYGAQMQGAYCLQPMLQAPNRALKITIP